MVDCGTNFAFGKRCCSTATSLALGEAAQRRLTMMRTAIKATWVASGKMANRDAGARLASPWISPLLPQANISATLSCTPSASPDEKHGAQGGLKLVGSEVVPFRGRGDDSLDEVGNRPESTCSLYSASMGEPLKASAVRLRDSLSAREFALLFHCGTAS